MHRTVWPVVLLVLTLAGGSARAAVVVALDLPTLVRSARVIAELEVVESESVRTPDGRIVTEHLALVREGIKGVRDGDEVRFFTEGGVVGDVGAWVPGEPRPRVGQRLVAFLEGAGDRLRFAGMSQGCLPISEGPEGTRVLPPAQDAVLVARTPRGVVRAAPAVSSPRPLAAFLQEVRALAAR